MKRRRFGALAFVRFFFSTFAALFLGWLVMGTGTVRAASFTASLDRDTIALGETATLSLSFEGGQAQNVPTPDVPGLRIVQTGTSQNVSIINGAMSSTVTVTFSITPEHDGEFTIPALTTEVNGQRLISRPLKLTVQKVAGPTAAAIASGNEVAFMKLMLPEQKVYVGQVLAAQLQIYLRDDVQNFGDFQFTSRSAEGFLIGKTVQGGRFRTQIGNHSYTVIPLSVALTVLKSGELNLGPFTAQLTVMLPSSNQQFGDPFFRQFFNQGDQKQISLATDQIGVQSLPLPDENRPANFSGAVGRYTLAVTAGPTNVAVGDPVTVRIQISGTGALDALALPEQPAWHDFKVYPPTSKVEASDNLGIQGTKTFEEIVSPENTSVHELPPFSFSYFDTDTGTYRTLTEPSVPLVVRATGMAPVPTIATSQNSGAQNQPPPRDLLPIKDQLGTLAPASIPLLTRPSFLVAQSLPVLAFLAAFVWRRRTDQLANNPRLRRQRAVAQLVASGMDDLNKYAAANQPDEFFATLFRLLQEQLGERLDCPASAITENVVEENSILRAAPTATRDALRDQFQLCNQARYAPVRGTAELNSVATQFGKVIGELQNLKA